MSYIHSLVCFTLTIFTLPLLGSEPLKDLSIEEKVGQMMMVHFNGEVANDEAKILVQQVHAGAIIYYNWANGLHSPLQVQQLSNGLQKLASSSSTQIPLLIATDQEGGVVIRLNRGFTSFPGNCALGNTNHPELAEPYAIAMAEELRAVGINMNLAPVVDINNNPLNPIIGVRAFGSSPEQVTRLGASTLKGYRASNVATTLKHFPGHGDVTADSHGDLPILNKSFQQLNNFELIPFRQLAASADAIMTAHLLVPSIDPTHCATLSSKILEGILRNDIGFQGVIISDSLIMEGVLKNAGSIENAAVQSIQAGCDMLIFGGRQLIGNRQGFELTTEDIVRIHQHLVDAVRSGTIAEKNIDASVERILALKKKYRLSRTAEPNEADIAKDVQTKSHVVLAKKVADLSIKTIKGDSLLPIATSKKTVCFILPAIIQANAEDTSLNTIGNQRELLIYQDLNPNEAKIQEAVAAAKRSDVVVMFSYNAWKNPGQQSLAAALSQVNLPLAVIALRDPQDAASIPQGDVIITTFSPATSSIQAAIDRLFGE